jgi:rfaE bifunctional protein nucleotidyltransferase chain/domain
MNHLQQIQNKIIRNKESFTPLLEKWRIQDLKIVFTNGCFDLLHRGHVEYLSKAADLGDILVIGLNTDESVSRIKGPHRPIQDEESRAQIMAALLFVDTVVFFNEETPYDLIKLVQPDVLVKGADYQPEDIVGYDILMAKGGEVATIEFLAGYSTSAIEHKIKSH